MFSSSFIPIAYIDILSGLLSNKKPFFKKLTNELSEMEVLDNIARSVVHDVSQALDKISDILERNNNAPGGAVQWLKVR